MLLDGRGDLLVARPTLLLTTNGVALLLACGAVMLESNTCNKSYLLGLNPVIY